MITRNLISWEIIVINLLELVVYFWGICYSVTEWKLLV